MTTLSGSLFAADDQALLLGDDFFPWIALAFGAAMVVGNIVALVRPPGPRDGSTPTGRPGGPGTPPATKPPMGRVVVMITLGLIVGIWGLASLIS